MARSNVHSLESHALHAVPDEQMIKFMSEVWNSPLRHQYWEPFKANLSLEEMSRLAKILPWDDPAARDLDFTVHKRRMHGKSILTFSFLALSLCSSPAFFRHTPSARANCPFILLAVGSNVVSTQLLEV